MAPGKWKYFYNGKWDESALGGKSSMASRSCATVRLPMACGSATGDAPTAFESDSSPACALAPPLVEWFGSKRRRARSFTSSPMDDRSASSTRDSGEGGSSAALPCPPTSPAQRRQSSSQSPEGRPPCFTTGLLRGSRLPRAQTISHQPASRRPRLRGACRRLRGACRRLRGARRRPRDGRGP